MTFRNTVLLFALMILAIALASCKKPQSYPPGLPGWHTPDYSVIFGQIQQPTDDPTALVIRYDTIISHDPYGGKLALTPYAMIRGFAPNDLIEIHGQILPNAGNPAGTGTLYQVSSIRLWDGSLRNR